jgi:putative tryptophan/tyrosine transport system substrate-binding protein
LVSGEAMRRRDFITFLGGTAAGWSVTARAQQRPATPVVGFLADGTPEGFAPRLAAVTRGLHETGFTEGQNVAIEPRWARRNYALLPSLADDLVRRKVSVIVTVGSEKVSKLRIDTLTSPSVTPCWGILQTPLDRPKSLTDIQLTDPLVAQGGQPSAVRIALTDL